MNELRAAARLALAVLLASGLLLAGGRAAGPTVAGAATPGLTLVTDAVYDVQPDRGRVVVTIAITATNHLHDTLTAYPYFRIVDKFPVLPHTSGFKLTAAPGNPHGLGETRTGVSTRFVNAAAVQPRRTR